MLSPDSYRERLSINFEEAVTLSSIVPRTNNPSLSVVSLRSFQNNKKNKNNRIVMLSLHNKQIIR